MSKYDFDEPKSFKGCETRLMRLRDEIADIKNQIVTADAQRQAGEPFDRQWVAKARGAKLWKQREITFLTEWKSGRKAPGLNKERFKNCLIEECRGRFTDEEWQDIKDAASHRMELEINRENGVVGGQE